MLYSSIGMNSPEDSGGMFVYQLLNAEGVALAVVYLPSDTKSIQGLAICLDASVGHRKAGIIRLAMLCRKKYAGTGVVGTIVSVGRAPKVVQRVPMGLSRIPEIPDSVPFRGRRMRSGQTKKRS